MQPNEITPKHDSTLGTVFRLNNLWADVDAPARKGDYDQWNNVLDRLYANLCYRNDMTIEKDDKGNIKSIELSSEDKGIHQFLSLRIAKFKKSYFKSKGFYKGRSKQKIYRGLWYKELMKKDLWLRKYMQSLGLYLKESKSTPGSSLFGS